MTYIENNAAISLVGNSKSLMNIDEWIAHARFWYLTMICAGQVLFNYTMGLDRVQLSNTSLERFIVKYHNNIITFSLLSRMLHLIVSRMCCFNRVQVIILSFINFQSIQFVSCAALTLWHQPTCLVFAKSTLYGVPHWEVTDAIVAELSWWRHQMETCSALLAFCAGNSPVTGEFPTQRPVSRSFDVFFDLYLNKRFSKQSWCWLFETPSWSLWRHCNGDVMQPFHSEA